MRAFLVIVCFIGFTLSGANIPDDPTFEDRRYSEWLKTLSDWRKNPGANESTRQAILSIGARGFPLLLKALSKEGLTETGSPSNTKSIEENRTHAICAVHILSTAAEPLVPDVLELVQERNWPGRHKAVLALSQTRSTNSAIVDLAFADLRSTKLEVQIQGILLLSGSDLSERVVGELVKRSESDVSKVREFAIYGLSKHLKNPDAREALSRIANRQSRYPEDRTYAKIALDPDCLKNGAGVVDAANISKIKTSPSSAQNLPKH